jgi:hypothetical protein
LEVSSTALAAKLLHSWSSFWNTSNGLPSLGITVTVGPVGADAQAAKVSMRANGRRKRVIVGLSNKTVGIVAN